MHWLCFFPAQASNYSNQQDTAWSFLTETSKKLTAIQEPYYCSFPSSFPILFRVLRYLEPCTGLTQLIPVHPNIPSKGVPAFPRKGFASEQAPIKEESSLHT